MVAEAVALAVGGAFLSSFLNVLFDRVATIKCFKLLDNVFRRTKMRNDLLQKMEIFLLTVYKVLGDAEEKQIINPYVKKWLDTLKDAAYDAEDLLDAIEIEGVQAQEEQVKDFNTRLERIVSKLELIAAEKDILSLKEGQGGKSIPRLPTTSLVDESEVCLRNEEKNYLLDILLSDGLNNRKGTPVIAIVGMGGIGKTTLAQFLYNDVRVKNYFNLRAWVHVSEEFDVIKLTKTIYESATLSHCDINDLNVLQVKLQRKLMGRKFLLVLDDVWNESLIEWDLLRRPLQVGAAGSKIILTTRNQVVSSTIHDVLLHDLKTLSEDNCWSLFARHAFGDKEPDENPTLKEIGEQIVKKCKGLPLVIRTLGSLLHSEIEAEEWKNVLNSKIWDLPDNKSDILPALRLSYHHLPSPLKRCFAYCSIFPKGHKFEKGDLIRMWIAEGFVLRPNSRRRMEEVGEQYFHELLSRSIFQRTHDQSYFTMHDLVNDLAQHVSGEFCFKFEHNSAPQDPARVRHLSFMVKPSDKPDKFVAFFEKNKVLRTFLPLRLRRDGKPLFHSRVFNQLFPESSCLRVLSLSSYNITEFPDSIGNLKQLRYLDLSGAAFQCLPERVGCLSTLETLKLSGCHRLTRLPSNLSNLTKLEHLDMNGTPIMELLDSIGSLKQLGYLDLSGAAFQCLPEKVSCLCNLKTVKLSGCRRLTQLPANLSNLSKLEHLDMHGTHILELLDSIGTVKQLGFLDLSGADFQCLPESVGCLFNLKTLKLSGCHRLTQLPANLSNLTILKHLDLNGTPISELLNSIGDLKQLGYLDLSCTAIQYLPESVGCLYNLETLKLAGCNDLTLLPLNLSNLTKLEHLDMNGTSILELLDSIGNLKQLGYLDLSCTAIQCLPESVGCLYNLETLKLSGCRRLTLLPANLCNLTKLEHLNIKGTPITQMPQKFSNLKRLRLLSNFVVGNNSASTISELKDLSLLHGTLCILQLQNVSQTVDAENADLKDKKHLHELIFEWDADPCNGNAQNAANDPQNGNTMNAASDFQDNGDAQNVADSPQNGNPENAANNLDDNSNAQNVADDPNYQDNLHGGQTAAEDDLQNSNTKHATNVLDKLQPSENLERLEIRNFFGIRLPKWLGNASFSKMQSLTLDNCRNCKSLPPLGQLHYLNKLTMHNLAGVKSVGPEFYGAGDVAFMSLETLKFERMENWEEWLPFTNGGGGLPSLCNLSIIECRKLNGVLPIPRPPNLHIEGCNIPVFQTTQTGNQ